MAMRLIIDSLIALMLVAILGALIIHQRDRQEQADRLVTVQTALRMLERQVLYQAAVDELEVTTTGYPLSVSPGWFPSGVPMNTLVPPSQPWMDIAPLGDMADHPPDPVIHHDDQAGFWYNPNRGIFRARILPSLTDAATLRQYNEVNMTGLLVLPHVTDHATQLARQPQPVMHEGVIFAATPEDKPRDVAVHTASNESEPPEQTDDPPARPGLLRR